MHSHRADIDTSTKTSAPRNMKKPKLEDIGDDGPSERSSKASTNVANACTNCQKRRTKCDGKNPCIKCSNRVGSVCTYEISLKASKAEMKRENNQLRQQLASSTHILSTLGSGHDNEVASILQGLRSQEQLATLAQRIAPSSPSSPQTKRSSSVDSHDTAFSHVPPHEKPEGTPSKSGTAYETLSTWPSSTTQESNISSHSSPYQSPISGPLSTGLDASSQTSHSDERAPFSESIGELRAKACFGPTDLSDHRLIKYLFSVYWVWVHPTHKVLDMDRFVKGYEVGSDAYCSLYLIYAVCIAACDHLDPLWENVEGKSTDVEQLRQNLMAEVRILESSMDTDDKAETTIQASAIMCLINAKTGDFSGKASSIEMDGSP